MSHACGVVKSELTCPIFFCNNHAKNLCFCVAIYHLKANMEVLLYLHQAVSLGGKVCPPSPLVDETLVCQHWAWFRIHITHTWCSYYAYISQKMSNIFAGTLGFSFFGYAISGNTDAGVLVAEQD